MGSGGDGAALARVTPYRDYLAWLARQDRAAALAAWQEALAGLEEATHVARAGCARERRLRRSSSRSALTRALSCGADASRRAGRV